MQYYIILDVGNSKNFEVLLLMGKVAIFTTIMINVTFRNWVQVSLVAAIVLIATVGITV